MKAVGLYLVPIKSYLQWTTARWLLDHPAYDFVHGDEEPATVGEQVMIEIDDWGGWVEVLLESKMVIIDGTVVDEREERGDNILLNKNTVL